MPSELGNKFTNEIYATKKDVQNTLKITLIDKYWADIVDYRSNFSSILGLKTIDGVNLSICLAPSISEKLNNIERKINKITTKFNNLPSVSLKDAVNESCYVEILKVICNDLMINASEGELKMILNGNLSAISPDKIVLSKYAALLKELGNAESLDSLIASNSYVKNSYISLAGSDYQDKEAVYREKSLFSAQTIISTVYNESPIRLLQPLMNDLYNFLSNSNKSFLIKLMVSIFYIYYLKPFEFYNEKMAVLLAKYIILNSDLEMAASVINIENILSKDNKVQDVINEVQKTADITYFVDYFSKKFDEELDKVITILNETKSKDIGNEYHGFEQKEVQVQPVKQVLNEEEMSLKIGVEEPQNHEIEEEQEEEKEETKPIFEEKEELAINAEIGSEKSDITYTRNPAITNITFGYNEEEAMRIENYLMETNPNLTAAQAYFYARHCTIDKFYTIAQYKKEIGCAYETARTSMDKLVSLGYYAKQGFKNKFIYTPIKRK